MKLEFIKTELLKNFKEADVLKYISYLNVLLTSKKSTGELIYKWSIYIKEEQAINLFKEAQNLSLTIDGDSVLIENKGSLKLCFTYQAYKNLVLIKYPESVIDYQIVFEEDKFNFKKENGKVFYTHEIINPFISKKNIIGCYCIIKNKTGEFIEIMNKEEINKCKKVAKTQSIWNDWEEQMIKKTVIKRACKNNFKDIVSDIDKIDNENYDLDLIKVNTEEIDLFQKINEIKTIEKLKEFYNSNKDKVKDVTLFHKKIVERKKEIENAIN